MKTAVSLPDQIYLRAEALAQRLGIARSRLYAEALAEYLTRHEHDSVTEALDAVYTDETATVDAGLAAAQSAILSEEW